MALLDERKRLSWSMTVLFTLVLAGCGGGSGGSDSSASTGNGTGSSQSSTASTDSQTQEPAQTASKPQQKAAAPEKPSEKTVADKAENAPPQIAQPGVVIENPIYADPLPVPVPDDAQPDSKPRDDSADKKDRAEQDDPEVAKPEPEPAPKPEAEPEPEEPAPVAERPTLRWDSPLSREDGSKLYPGEISGYRVYYRLRHQDEFKAIPLNGPDVASMKLDKFKPGAYEFAVSTVDVDGMESRRSEPVKVDLI